MSEIYKNPIIHTDYSDPDIVRDGDVFYMTASSFSNVPGLPILRSYDLVNWELVNYAVKELPFAEYNVPNYGCGVWAPAIRKHGGYFYIYVGLPDEGVFMTRAEDPLGEWEPLHCVKKVRGWIDTCPLWDDDGKAYLVNAFANSRIGFKSVLAVSEMSADGRLLTGDFRIVYDGNENNIDPTIEGPKFYKRNGWYYIAAPSGGVKTGWQVVLRSRSVYGPYERKVTLHQGGSIVNGPHQGGWVDLDNGESWFAHFQDKGAYGRIVHLQPMRWEDDWPVMGVDTNNVGIGEPVLEYRMPNLPGRLQSQSLAGFSRNFLPWQWNANPKGEWFSFEGDKLRLFAVNEYDVNGKERVLFNAPNILTQKFFAETFTVTTKMEFNPANMGESAGFVVLGETYYAVSLVKGEFNIYLTLTHGRFAGKDAAEVVVYSAPAVIASEAKQSAAVYIRLEVGQGAMCQFSYSYDNEEFSPIGTPFTATVNRWVGAKFGLFCCAQGGGRGRGYADFEWGYNNET